jgi:hypothetical protein
LSSIPTKENASAQLPNDVVEFREETTNGSGTATVNSYYRRPAIQVAVNRGRERNCSRLLSASFQHVVAVLGVLFSTARVSAMRTCSLEFVVGMAVGAF